MRTSRRFQVHLARPLADDLVGFAQLHSLGLAPAIRFLIKRGIQAQEVEHPDAASVSLAALVAAEHAVLMVASILPEGERRMRESGERASMAAQERLASFSPEGER